jgi:hypothetical protein
VALDGRDLGIIPPICRVLDNKEFLVSAASQDAFCMLFAIGKSSGGRSRQFGAGFVRGRHSFNGMRIKDAAEDEMEQYCQGSRDLPARKAHHCLIEKKLYYYYSSIRHICTIDR